MILTNCAACAAPLALDAPRCIRCHVVVVLGVGVCVVARRRRAAPEASNSVQQLEALKELSLKLNPQEL